MGKYNIESNILLFYGKNHPPNIHCLQGLIDDNKAKGLLASKQDGV